MRLRLVGLLVAVLLLAGLAAPASNGAAAQETTVLEEINFRNGLVAAQESLLNTYRCLFNIDVGVVPGGCVDGQPAGGPIQPDEFVGVPTASEVEVRDRLVAAQESLLNTYRCLFNVDTEIVPDGCRVDDGEPPEEAERSVPTGSTGHLNGAIITTECNDGRPRGGTLTIGMFGETFGWDPTLNHGSAPLGGTQLTALYDALFYLDQTTGQLVPGLAESIATDDNRVYTLKLREGINFTDGTPLDADAFIWNVEHHQRSEVGSESRYAADRIAAVNKVDDLTVELTSYSVNATFPQIFAHHLAWMMSPTAYQGGQDFQTGLNDRINSRPVGVGAGPFMFESWERDNRAVLVRNPGYFRGGCPYLDKVVFMPIIDPIQRYNAFRVGDLDIAYDRHPVNLQDAKQRGINTATRVDNHGGSWMLNGSKEPFNIRACRVAAAHAIDYDTVNDIVYDGTRTYERSLMAPGSPWHDPGAALPDYDPFAAAAALRQCEAELGGPLEFETLCTTGPENVLITGTLVAMWNAVGIKATANCVDVGELVTAVFSGDAVANPWALPVDDPDEMYEVYFGDSPSDGNCGNIVSIRNWSKSCFPEFDQGLTQGRRGLTFEERYEGYSRFQRKFAEEVPVIIMDKPEAGYYWADEVSGVFMSVTGLLLLAFTARG
ncbi:MAG: ABC transporter substrate-binding protein [Acidimicrobiia bacterium]|nr:ABC transporter substrate-binding protein [Acidimicrobiia bacterium]